MVHVKICGIRRAEDARAAVEAGVSALGFNFWPQSSRYIEPAEAAAIIAAVPPRIATVAVFVDETSERVLEIARQTGVSMLQLHGSESGEYLDHLDSYPKIKAVRVGREFDPRQLDPYRSAAAILLDCHVDGQVGGTGRTFDWAQAVRAKPFGRIILAGGLTPKNVGAAIMRVEPWAVDVASGVESEPGVKDARLMREFIHEVRAAEARIAAARLPFRS